MAPPKGKKGQTMSLADFAKSFQAEGPSAASSASWADEDIELPSAPLGQDRSAYDRPGRIPAAGRNRREDAAPLPVVIDQRALPREPPFMAFVGNLSYDAHEEDIREFFSGVAVKGVRFPKSGDSGPRGFCYVEFHSVEGLTEGLLKSGQLVKGRPCRVDIATAKREERDEHLSFGNWREGHQVVERSGGASSPRGGHGAGGPGEFRNPLAAGNWRDTAQPIESLAQPAPVRRESTSAMAPPVPGKKPELKLTPRTKPVAEGEQLATEEYKKSKKPNPFGEAKPRELVLAEKKESAEK